MNRGSYLSCLLMLSGLVVGCDRSVPQPVVSPEAASSAGPSSPQSLALTSATGSTPAPVAEGASAADSVAGPEPSFRGISPPVTGPDGQPLDSKQVAAKLELENRPFMTLQPITTTDPEALIEHLRQIDAALQDLVLAGSANFLDEKTFTDGGLRLGKMKRAAGAQLADSPEASQEQRKSGLIAQLVALSHMSGLRDVQAAQELERFAQELANSGDADLVHQSHVVLIGFELQALQNGLRQQPDALLRQVAGLLTRQQDRGFPEFMVLQQAQQVLTQMGFADAAQSVRQTVIEAYRNAPDAQLRGEAWLSEVQTSQAYQNFLQAFRNLGGDGFDGAAAFAAVRGLYDAFPTLQTLEQIATTIANIEYSGQVPLSQEVANFTRQKLPEFSSADTSYVDMALSHHAARMKLLDSPVELEGLVGFDGRPLDWSEYQGQVVLVDFWASWCVKCLREIPVIRQVHREFAEQGFAVLSVNMDENLANGREFVKQQEFPWRSYHAADPQALGFKSPLAKTLGINAIPFMMLVDRDGRIAALHVRGSQLRPAVERMLVEGK